MALTFPHYAAEAVKITYERMKIFDGDTFASDGLIIRILGLDTPEIAVPEYGFFEDQPSGREAALKAGELFRNAGIIEYLPYEPDQYKRMLAHVFIDGELFAVKMIEAGLAYETVNYYGDNGFPDIADLILAAAEKAGPPPFQEPHIWRREHRREPAPASN